MHPADIIVEKDCVIIEGVRVDRPYGRAISSWMAFWEAAKKLARKGSPA